MCSISYFCQRSGYFILQPCGSVPESCRDTWGILPHGKKQVWVAALKRPLVHKTLIKFSVNLEVSLVLTQIFSCCALSSFAHSPHAPNWKFRDVSSCVATSSQELTQGFRKQMPDSKGLRLMHFTTPGFVSAFSCISKCFLRHILHLHPLVISQSSLGHLAGCRITASVCSNISPVHGRVFSEQVFGKFVFLPWFQLNTFCR